MHKFDNDIRIEDLHFVIYIHKIAIHYHKSIPCNNIETMNTNDGVTSKGVESDLKSNLTNIMEATDIGKNITDC